MTKTMRTVMSLLFAVSIMINAVISILMIKKEIEQKNETVSTVLSTGVFGTIESELAKPIRTSLTMANDSFLVNALKNEESCTEDEMISAMSEYLTMIKDGLEADTAFVVSDKTGRYYSYSGLNKIIDIDNDEHDIWYSIFVNGKKAYDLDVDVDEVNGGRWTVFINCRIEDTDGRLLGVCGVGVTMNEIQDILDSYEKKYDIKVNLVNSDGLVQVDTDSINIENSYLYDVQYGKSQDGYKYTGDDGSFVIMRYVEDLNWYLVIRSRPDKFTDSMLIIIISSICVVLINLIIFFAAKAAAKKHGSDQS